jgi:tetratricopeptide (TPR) repeat protein
VDRAVVIVERALKALQSGDVDRAASLAREAKSAAPRSPRVRELLGLAAYRTGEFHEALKELQTYRRLTGFLDENHVIADCQRALGQPARALATCAEVVQQRVSPSVWAETKIIAAATLADEGDFDGALREIRQADVDTRETQDYHLRVWYVAGDILERMGRHDDARSLWERVYAEDPDFFDVEDRLQAG